jgi:hypothetical protein
VWWILALALQATVIGCGIRQEQRAGLWSWSKFFFALAFGILECIILMAPDTYIDPRNRYFVPVMITAAVVAALNFIWFIVVMRRWRLPDGRTSLQAYRDQQQGL